MKLLIITLLPAFSIALLIFALILIFCYLGFNRRLVRLKSTTEDKLDMGTFSASVLGLLALLLSFTFNMAYSRYDSRREVIVQEANEIGTAILRTELYPDSITRLMKAEFEKYIDARIVYFDAGTNMARVKETINEATKHSDSIWKIIKQQAQDPANLVRSNQMIPAMNGVIDIVTTREKLTRAYIPDPILIVLVLLIVICSFMIGFSVKNKKSLLIVAALFAFVICITMFLIVDLVQSSKGFITQDAAQQSIVELKSLITD